MDNRTQDTALRTVPTIYMDYLFLETQVNRFYKVFRVKVYEQCV